MYNREIVESNKVFKEAGGKTTQKSLDLIIQTMYSFHTLGLYSRLLFSTVSHQ